MNPTSKQPENLSKLLDQLEDKLSKIEGNNSSDFRTEKTQEKNQQAASGSSSSVSAPTTPRLASGPKSAEKDALAFDGSKVNRDPHTTPIKRAKLVRQINIKKEEMRLSKKSIDDDKSSSSTTPRSVRFASSDANTSVSNRSAAPTPASTPMPTPVATPRTAEVANDDSSSDSSGRSRPVSPRAKQLRKKISKGFSRAALNISKFGEKLSSQVASISTSNLPTPKSSGRNSPEVHSSTRSSEKSNPFPEITPSIKNQAARALLKLQSDEGYKNSGDTRKKFMLNSELINVLSNNAIEINAPRLKFLQKEAVERSTYAVIDKTIDLGDAQFLDFVKAAAEGAFIKTWDKDSSDAGLELKKYYNVVKPTFARDFKNSSYEIKNSDGSLRKISTIEEFIEFIGNGNEGNLPMVVSNIASQNFGNFLKNVLFLRENKEKISQSILRLDDGTPVMPLAIAKAKYTLSKNSDGKIVIDYEWNASQEINGEKEMRVKKMTGDQSQSLVKDATLNIKVNIEINPDGRWHINNPHVIAENWNNVVS
jgi:hypothetical protein